MLQAHSPTLQPSPRPSSANASQPRPGVPPCTSTTQPCNPSHALPLQTHHDPSHGQVSRLVGLLAPLFPTRPGSDGEPRVVPYHKSVLDWLNPELSSSAKEQDHTSEDAQTPKQAAPQKAHAYAVDVSVGHQLLAEATAALAVSTGGQALEASEQRRSSEQHGLHDDEMPALQLPGGRYALHHTVAHACLAAAGSSTPSPAVQSLLRKLLLDFGFWQQVFGAGEDQGIPERLAALHSAHALHATALQLFSQTHWHVHGPQASNHCRSLA